jgi:hypothetical protein
MLRRGLQNMLMPELVVWFEAAVGAVRFPSELDFVKNRLSVWSNFVVLMKLPLRENPPPKRLVLFVLTWHHTMTIRSLKLDKLFILLIPFTFQFINFPSESNLVQNYLTIMSNFVVLVIAPLLFDPLP